MVRYIEILEQFKGANVAVFNDGFLGRK